MNGSLDDLSNLRIAHSILSDGPGGAERVVAELAMAVQAAGAYTVVMLPAGGEGWLARQLDGSGVVIEYIRFDRPLSAGYARSLIAAFRRHRITVAHSHEFTMAVYGAATAWWTGVPHVITMHGGRYYANRLRRRLALRAAVALSARTVGVSTSVARWLSRDLGVSPSRIATIPNGVRYVPAERTTVRDELGLRAADRLLISVGNLYPVKGHLYLVDALAPLQTRHPTLHLAIAGRGELEDALAARARHHGVGDRVHLLGLRSDIPAILKAADVFVLPSLSEGLPLAILEAMFSGCPIVASDVGEVGAALAHGDAGMLVPAGDPDALAAALDRVLGDPQRAAELGRRARLRAAAEYDVSQTIRRYVATYQELLPSPEPSVAGVSARVA